MTTEPPLSLEQIYTRFSQRLLAFILRRIPERETAEDILHTVILKIHNRIDTLRDSEKIESWVFQVTRNAIVDHLRATKPNVPLEAVSELAEEPSEKSASERLEPSVRAFIEELPEPYREALRLVELEGMSQKELAQRLGISVSGAKSRVQRARAMLRDLLMRCCHFEFDRFGTILDYHPISCCCCEQHARTAKGQA